MSNYLPALRRRVAHSVSSGTKILFWKDRWLNGQAPMLIWPEEFRGSLNPNSSICDFEYLCSEEPFAEHEDVVSFRN